MNGTQLKTWVGESPALVRGYASVLATGARLSLLRGRKLAGAELLLRAWRAAGTDAFPPARVERFRALLRERCCRGGALAPVAENGFLREYLAGPEAAAVRRTFGAWPVAERVRFRSPGADDPERQGDLVVLKRHGPATGEKGVILVKYSEWIRRLPALFDLPRLAAEYALVLEPSWWGYQSTTFLLYAGADVDALVQAPWAPDHDFIASLDINLVPIRVGAGDWVDPGTFRSGPAAGRTYDLVMVSAWSPVKRHDELFEALAALRREHGRTLRVALIGYPQVWTRAHIEKRMRRHGVEDCCDVFEKIPHEEVARIVADSRAYVLLSRREGANKALYESLFCGTPVVVPAGHRGVNAEHVRGSGGVLFEEGGLPAALLRALDGGERPSPREWALEHTGWRRSSELVNARLREMSLARGLPWTHDMHPKKNAPSLRYAAPGAHRAFDDEYRRLAGFLL